MDIITVLESSGAPLTIEEIKKFSGPMYSNERFDSLIRSGEIREVEGLENVYWSVPPALKKRNTNQTRKCISPFNSKQRELEISKVIELRNKLFSITEELYFLQHKSENLPTEEQYKNHIKRLHKYNETKDEGIKLIEQIANMEGIPVHEVYERFEIDENMLS